MILRVLIEEPVAPAIVSVELPAVVCVRETLMAPPPLNVCCALPATGSSRVTNERANRPNFRPAERRANAETGFVETMATPHVIRVQAHSIERNKSRGQKDFLTARLSYYWDLRL
jgi:hypothetical protein